MGIIVVKSEEQWKDLWSIRTFTGTVPGSLENWLLLRSLRTMDLVKTLPLHVGQVLTWSGRASASESKQRRPLSWRSG